MSTLTISLNNKSALKATDYTIYVMAFSSTSQVQLSVDTGTTAKFKAITAESGDLNMFALGATAVGTYKGITEIDIDTLTAIKGARIYFFFANNTTFPKAPKVSFSNFGKSVVNVPNPPNSDYAPYTFAEFTNSPDYGAVIDSQTVDGFTAPVAIEIFDGSKALKSVGNDLSLTRKQVIDEFKPFINGLSDATAGDFLDLQYSDNSGGLLNPGAYLNDVSATNEFNNINSNLNSIFDAELNTFFSTTSLSIKGVGHGSVTEQTYTATSVNENLPGTSVSHQALKLTGSAGQDYYMWNPVGVCVMTDNGTAIKGSIDGLKMTFKTPLTEATIVEGMSLKGMGVPANQVTVGKVTSTNNAISSLDLNFDWGTLPANSMYTFTNATGVVTKLEASIVGDVLTFTTAVPVADQDKLAGSTVVGAGISGDITVATLTADGDAKYSGATLNMSLGQPPANSQYYFSNLPGVFLTSGNMVFANQGLFAYTAGVTNTDQQNVLLNLQNQIVTAFNRGVANSGPTSGTPGYTSMYWGDESNWYPEGVIQNLFSMFMHTAEVTLPTASGDTKPPTITPIFIQDPDSVNCARTKIMGQAYGFAYDENPMFVANAAPVPSKFDPAPADTTEMKITLGDWGIS